MYTFVQELRHGVRVLVKRPGFTLAAIVMLVLGIGVNVAIFSVVNTVLWRALPFAEPDRLVLIMESYQRNGQRVPNFIAPANYRDWNTQNHSFSEMAYYTFSTTARNLTGSGEPRKLEAMYVSDNLFQVLGTHALIGRTLQPNDAKVDTQSGAVLSYRLWQRQFAGDPNIVGKTIKLDDVDAEVIGVMPPSFEFPEPTVDLWLPHTLSPGQSGMRQAHYLHGVGRLKPGVTVEQADAELVAIAQRLREQYPEANENVSAIVTSLRDSIVGDMRRPLLLLMASAALVLLIGCANIANLLLAQAVSREKEFALRAALGARRSRLVRQLFTEILVLLTVGSGLGFLFAYWVVRYLVSLMPNDIAQATSATIDKRALLFAIAVSLLTGLLFGLVPALQWSKPDLNSTLKDGAGSSGPGRQRLRQLLVVAETALAIVLLTGAGLLVRSFVRLSKVDPGFVTEHVLTFEVPLPFAKYDDVTKRSAFFADLTHRLQTTPGIESAGVTFAVPLTKWGPGMTWITEQKGEPKVVPALPRTTDAGFFAALKVPLLRGRLFNDGDQLNSPKVVVITDRMARAAWPGEDPIGKRMKMGIESTPWLTVVGVVGDVRTLVTIAPFQIVYMPYTQSTAFQPQDVVVRTQVDPSSVMPAVREVVHEIDKDLPVANLRTMSGVMSAATARQRFNLLLMGFFAALAIVMAAVGLYGVMAYIVAHHTREIGIRMALGARPKAIFKLIIGHGMVLAAIGVVLGVAGGLALTRLMTSLLFEVKANDPLTFIVVSLGSVAVAFIACYVPARRAMKLDPLVALRHE